MKTKYSLSPLASGARTAALIVSIATLVGATQSTQSATPSEVLEKAVYSEETKGDLDGAIGLYQQVVTEAKGAQAVAAQAQYRLGVCYYKKKSFGEATAAFQKLLKDYPDQKEYVALANKYLAGAATLMPAPWVDGEEMLLDVKFPTGYKLGSAVYRVALGETNGQKICRLSSHLFAGVEQCSRVEVEADSFKPIHCRWKHTLIGDADTTYFPGHAEVKLVGQKEAKKIDLEGVVYDNEEAVQLMRRMPLAADYAGSVRILTGLGGGNMIDLKVEVTGQEKVQVPAGTFDCYKVELSLVHQTFWYSTDAHHYVVKFEGGGVVAELTAVNQRKEGEAVKYKDPLLGFSLAAPADWLFNRTEAKDEKGKSRVMVLDPDATAVAIVSVGSIKDLKPDMQKSLRAWAELEVTDNNKALQELKVRPDSWTDRTVAGRPGLSVTGDFVEGKEKKVGYAVFTFGETNAAAFVLMCQAADFDAFKPKFDAIVDSYNGK